MKNGSVIIMISLQMIGWKILLNNCNVQALKNVDYESNDHVFNYLNCNVQALKNADAQIDFQTDFVTEIARLGF